MMFRFVLLATALVAVFGGVDLPHLRRAIAPARAVAVTSIDGSVYDERARGRRRGRERQDIRRRISENQDGTYIGDLLAGHDSALARWPERLDRPITVWVQPRSAVGDWHPDYPAVAREAFEDWERTGIPLRFRFVDDSSRAEVQLRWIDRFREPISGRTLWARDDNWWILDGSITIAMHHSRGDALDSAAVKAITLHEVGHLIGLDHTGDQSTIMTPRVRVRKLASADKATARLLYTLPAGTVR